MKKDSKRYDYGTCHACGGPMRPKLIKQDFWIKGNLIVIEGIPAGACTRCGEKVVQAEVGRSIAELVADPHRPRRARTLKVPVIRFGQAVA